MDEKTRALLDRFCARVQQLLDSRYLSNATIGGIKFQMTLKKGGPLEHERTGPDEEAVRAFLLDLRFFVQDNEPTSIRNISEVVSRSAMPRDLKDQFAEVRRSLNENLDSPGPIVVHVNGQVISRRDIFYTFLYGMYAHENRRYQTTLQEWRSSGLEPLLRSEFDNVVLGVLQALHFLRTIGREMLEST